MIITNEEVFFEQQWPGRETKNTPGECNYISNVPSRSDLNLPRSLVGRSATCQMAHLWTGLEIASIIQRPLDLILMLQASCSSDFQGNPNSATLRIRDMSGGVSKPPVLKPHGLGGFGVSIGGGSGFFREPQKHPSCRHFQGFVQHWTSTWPPELLTGGPKTCCFILVFW